MPIKDPQGVVILADDGRSTILAVLSLMSIVMLHHRRRTLQSPIVALNLRLESGRQGGSQRPPREREREREQEEGRESATATRNHKLCGLLVR